MEAEFKLKEKLRAKFFTTEKLLDGYASCLRKNLPKNNCKILDVACGQSLDILDLINREYNFTAVDSDEVPLKLLQERIKNINQEFISKVEFLKGEFPSINLPYQNYDAILFHNILHFFSLNELIEIFKPINSKIKTGAVISVVVHSSKHAKNNSSNSNQNNFFKHYFEFNDLRKIFQENDFEMILEADLIGSKTREDIEFLKLWCHELYTKLHGMRDENKIRFLTNKYIKDSGGRFALLHYIIRKKNSISNN